MLGPVDAQVSRRVKVSVSDRGFPALTGRSGTQRARRLRSHWLKQFLGGRRPGARLLLYWRVRATSSLPQPDTDGGCSCTSRSILEPEAPPEAEESRTVPGGAGSAHGGVAFLARKSYQSFQVGGTCT